MKKRPAPISTSHFESSGSSPSSLSPSTTEVSDSDSQHSFTSAEMPLTKAKLERVLHRDKRGNTPSSAPANGIFKFNWWRDSNDGSESEEENYPPTPMAMTPRIPESPTSPRHHTARLRRVHSPRLATPVSGMPRTPTSARPVTPVSRMPRTPTSARPATPVSGMPRTPTSARPARTPVSARQTMPALRHPRTPLSATTFVQPSPVSARRFETVPRSQLALRLEQTASPSTAKPPRFRRRPTELKLTSQSLSESSEDLSTSPSSASSSSVPPSPTDSLPPSPSALSVPQYTSIDMMMEPAIESQSPLPGNIFSPVLASPATPFSPSTRFCARSASRQVKQFEGYVSFGAIEGLGMPDMDDELQSVQEDEEQVKPKQNRKDGSWTPKWLTVWKL